jgi:signal transduction histidine kinase
MGLSLAVGLMGVCIAVVTVSSQRQGQMLRTRLTQVDSESFRIADHFKDALREVIDHARHYREEKDTSSWQDFLKSSAELESWISGQGSKLTTQREKEVLQEITAAYSVCLGTAKELYGPQQSSGASDAAQAESKRFRDQSRHLADLGQDLARAHYESRNLVLAHANKTLTQLRITVLASLALLFLFATALALGIYRHLIAPLRIKLAENQSLIERQEKLASLGMLAAGVAHEIRNPLTAIKASLFTQQKRFQPGSPEQKDSAVIEREILRLERIVNEFLRFARPADPELATIPADQPLQEVRNLLSEQLAKADIKLVCEKSSATPIRVDPEQIKQALINLVQNAADSINHHGTISLRARQTKGRIKNGESDVVVLEVSDNGKGILPEVQARLFDPFFTTKENGTGLGLSIASRIVEKHGGVLQYQTQVNRGTSFFIVLPAKN